MSNETHRTPLRYKISEFFSNLLETNLRQNLNGLHSNMTRLSRIVVLLTSFWLIAASALGESCLNEGRLDFAAGWSQMEMLEGSWRNLLVLECCGG